MHISNIRWMRSASGLESHQECLAFVMALHPRCRRDRLRNVSLDGHLEAHAYGGIGPRQWVVDCMVEEACGCHAPTEDWLIMELMEGWPEY